VTEDYSRPATLDDVKALIRALNAQNADYLLIGGYALFAHGYHRSTTDIDVLVPANREAGKRIIDALMALPDQAAKEIDPAWFEESRRFAAHQAGDAGKRRVGPDHPGKSAENPAREFPLIYFPVLPVNCGFRRKPLRTIAAPANAAAM
jgi:hypothetical protein